MGDRVVPAYLRRAPRDRRECCRDAPEGLLGQVVVLERRYRGHEPLRRVRRGRPVRGRQTIPAWHRDRHAPTRSALVRERDRRRVWHRSFHASTSEPLGRRRGGGRVRRDGQTGLDQPAHFVVGAAEELPFRARSFELATVASAIHWFPPAATDELRRVLQQDGLLLIYDVWFRAEMDSVPGFGDWLSDVSNERYAPVAKNPCRTCNAMASTASGIRMLDGKW